VANYRAFVPDARWKPSWMPLFANGGGDFYVADLTGSISGSVRHFRIEESEHPVEFLSIEDMLVTLAAAYERGVFFVDVHGYLEMDDPAFRPDRKHGRIATTSGLLFEERRQTPAPPGGTIRSMAIGIPDPGHGLPKVICTSCSTVLDVFGAGR